MATAQTQRSYRAPCPGCGAPVEFRSAQSTHAVCSFCQSTVVRSGDKLERLGKMAELFDDHSPLRLHARGKWQGKHFTLIGRLQYCGPSGPWTEWYVLFDDGSNGYLAEDNGSYVFALPARTERELPKAEAFRVGATTAISGKTYTVAMNEQVALISAQGELPKLPPLDHPFAAVELRSADNEVLSVDYGGATPALSSGKPVALEELDLTGLAEESAKEEKARQFNCPNCGAPVTVQFASSKAVTCASCNSLIDLQEGIGGELRHAEQHEPMRPTIPLGSTGQLQGVHWQVVGYQHRLGHEPGDDDESFGWDEYLLYNRKRGFTFLVDSSDGWSLVKPATGAPTVSENKQVARYLNINYQLQYSYHAETTYVAGEFYWPVVRGNKTFNRDYAKGKHLLSMEETPTELTWSVGSKIESDAVATAFKLEDKKELLKRSDGGPTTPGKVGTGCGCAMIIGFVILIIILLILVKACDDDSTSSGYSSGRSSGGWSSGGGGSHK